MLGIALGIAALIVVMSVMNGFQKRGPLAHPRRGLARADAGGPGRAAGLAPRRGRGARRIPQVVAAAPFVSAQGLLSSGTQVQGVLIRGMRARARGPGGRHRQAHERRQARRPAARGVRHRPRHRPRARAARAAGRAGHAHRAAGAGDAAGLVPRLKQFRVVGHLQRRPLRVRLRARADPHGGCPGALPAGRLGERRAPQAHRPLRGAARGARAREVDRRATPTSPTGRSRTPTSSAPCRSRSA